jgi:trehalose 6-phosphate phosphatase
VSDALPPFERAALLLDLDGTLLDIAPTPDAVVVAPGLPETLLRLRARLGGAVAVVTGRPVHQVDALLPGFIPTVSGEHGGALRPAPGAALVRAALPDLPPGLMEAGMALAASHPGVLLERKARGFVLHFRQAPDSGPALRQALSVLLAPHDATFQLLAAHMAWEIRPRGADKGSAVLAVMALPAFAGRVPVFIGDDVTDEDGMRPARAMGGAGLFVPDVFGDAAGVRAWLARCVEGWAAYR